MKDNSYKFNHLEDAVGRLEKGSVDVYHFDKALPKFWVKLIFIIFSFMAVQMIAKNKVCN